MRWFIKRPGRWTALATSSVLAFTVTGAITPVTLPIKLPNHDGQIGRALVRTSLWGAAFAQTAEAVMLENVTLSFPNNTVRVPRAEFRGVTLSRAELMNLLDPSAAEPMAPRLARLSAKQVTIPEIVLEQRIGPQRQTTRYRNLVATDVEQGRVRSITSEAAAFEVSGEQKATGTGGRASVADFDLPELVRLYTEKAETAAAPLKRVYGAFSFEDFALNDDKGLSIKVARMAGDEFLARPTRDSWGGVLASFASLEKGEKPSDAETQRLLRQSADLLGAFQIGSMEATGFEFRDPTSKNGAIGRIARLAYTGAKAGRSAEMRVEGFEVAAKDGRARLDLMSFNGFSFESSLEGLRAMGDKPVTDLDAADLRKLVPTIGTVRLGGLDIDVPNEADKGPKPERIRFGVKGVEVTADRPINGVPTNLRLALDNLSFAVPPNSKESGLKELAGMGYKAVDLSFVTAASWNEPGGELVLREVGLRGAEMGSVSLRGVLGDVTRDVFNADSAVAMVALVGATLRNADLTVENNGLVERLLAQEARKQKKTPEALRRDYGTAAAFAVPAMLGNSAQAKTLGQAVARFIAKPGRLAISARTKDPAGLGVADIAALGEPQAVLEKLDVTATTE